MLAIAYAAAAATLRHFSFITPIRCRLVAADAAIAMLCYADAITPFFDAAAMPRLFHDTLLPLSYA